MTPFHIVVDDLTDADVIALLETHLAGMYADSPPESVHALDLDGLRAPGVTFWTVRDTDAELLGCGALKELSDDHGEIKSMRTASAHLGRGVATVLLGHILEEAKRRSYRRVSLETGSGVSFAAARALYRKHGFEDCGPFAGYVEDPYSHFMTKEI